LMNPKRLPAAARWLKHRRNGFSHN
jgi:hypothetical protein